MNNLFLTTNQSTGKLIAQNKQAKPEDKANLVFDQRTNTILNRVDTGKTGKRQCLTWNEPNPQKKAPTFKDCEGRNVSGDED